jgi:putative ABC transport system ATP-binding protein
MERMPQFYRKKILMQAPLMQVENLSRSFNLSKDHSNLVIPGLDMTIGQGEFVAIMGSSGSGKSTLLYLLGGLDEPSGGQVRMNGRALPSGQNANARFRRKTMGMVFQHNNLIPGLTLLENILVAAFLVQKNRNEARKRALGLMTELGIDSLKDRYPAQVSGGEQQRCAIARALVNAPRILLADEPTGSLNSSATRKVLETFSVLNGQGQTIVMVTHEIEAACYAGRVVFLRDGTYVDDYSMDAGGSRTEKEKALLDWLTEKGW